MDSTGLSYNSKRQPSNNTRDARAAAAVNDWASKRKDQIEKAKQLREERKYGSSHLQSAGENTIVANSSAGSGVQNNLWRNTQNGYGGPGSLQPPLSLGHSYEYNQGSSNYSHNDIFNNEEKSPGLYNNFGGMGSNWVDRHNTISHEQNPSMT